MRLLYITTKDFSRGMSDGVVKKIQGQIECFKKYGFEVDLIYRDSSVKSMKMVRDGVENVLGEFDFLPGIFTKKIIAEYLIKNQSLIKYDACYIRFLGGRTDPWFIKILKILKKAGIRILLEIPTYPYDMERQKLDMIVDRIYRGRLKKYIDRIITFSCDDEIFGIKTINTMNGIDVESISTVNGKLSEPNTLDLIAVASFEPGHGYERVIEGLKEYYKKPTYTIHIHMVGDGGDRSLYEALVKEYGLQKNVLFYGKKMGEELDEIYNKADIALGTFGWYKKNNYYLSSLKTREYLSKGLPIVTGVTEDVLVNNEFGFEFANDSSPVDFNEIIDWYTALLCKYGDARAISSETRSYAEKYLDYTITLKPIIDYIQGT